MAAKAPDTRNKLDDNKGLKKGPKKKPKAQKPQVIKLKAVKELKQVIEGHEVTVTKYEQQETKAQSFKRTHGYSRSIQRAMNRLGVTSFEAYKAHRNKTKKAAIKVRQEKHKASVAFKMANRKGSKTGSKKKSS